MVDPMNYVVESVGVEANRGPSELRCVPNPPSDFREDVKDEDLFEALILHCKTGHEQAEMLRK